MTNPNSQILAILELHVDVEGPEVQPHSLSAEDWQYSLLLLYLISLGHVFDIQRNLG